MRGAAEKEKELSSHGARGFRGQKQVSARPRPTFLEEERLKGQGYRFVAGIDEAGRGPLAGPVVAAAVILKSEASWLRLVDDSKRLTSLRREFLFQRIQEEAVALSTGIVASEVIDEVGIVAATRLAMCAAVEKLSLSPDFLLIDALDLLNLSLPQKSITRGDSLSLSIAAASIIAKVTRDRLMVELDGLHRGYGFARQGKGNSHADDG